MRWGTERTGEFDEWWETLTEREKRQVSASIEKVEVVVGPGAGRPFVDSVKGSKHPT
jgi:hypothetical protein